MGKKTRLFRVLKILSLMSSGYKKWTAGDLAVLFGVSERTIHRDKKWLEELGIPFYYDPGKKSYVIMENYYFTPPDITKDEALALFIVGQAYEGDNFPYKEELETGLAKIINSLPGSIKNILKDFEEKIYFQRNHSVDLSAYKKVIRKLELSIENKNTVEILYYSLSSDKSKKRKVDPYTMFFNDAGYLVAFCHINKEVRLFRIDRINRIKVLDESFKKVDGYSIDKYLKNAWGVERGKVMRVKLLFSGFASRYVREINWHPSQIIKEINENQILYIVDTGSIKEIKSWILSFGSEVKVLEPKELKKEVKLEIKKMGEKY